MIGKPVILNEIEARRARSMIASIDDALSSKGTFEPIRSGIPANVVNNHRKAITAQKASLDGALQEYVQAKAGDVAPLAARWSRDPGLMLIIARLARGMSQAELAKKIGVKEQQIQRYEAERYRAISLSNYKRLAAFLGVNITAGLNQGSETWLGLLQPMNPTYTNAQLEKILLHAEQQNWFPLPDSAEERQACLLDYIAETNVAHGSLALLRTGLSNEDLSDDVSLMSWRARVTKLAEAAIEDQSQPVDFLDIGWLSDFVRLSVRDDGPLKAREFLNSKGIVLVTEPQIPGLKLDGAAFIVRGVPIIALTLRYDRLDNFWFTLLHELAHVLLHHHVGLSSGFFDDFDQEHTDQVETEANEFAESILIPPDRWKSSPARISKAAEPIEALAKQLNIHSAIVFGRIRKERNNYKLFSDRVGAGHVRKWLQHA